MTEPIKEILTTPYGPVQITLNGRDEITINSPREGSAQFNELPLTINKCEYTVRAEFFIGEDGSLKRSRPVNATGDCETISYGGYWELRRLGSFDSRGITTAADKKFNQSIPALVEEWIRANSDKRHLAEMRKVARLMESRLSSIQAKEKEIATLKEEVALLQGLHTALSNDEPRPAIDPPRCHQCFTPLYFRTSGFGADSHKDPQCGKCSHRTMKPL